jgi:hypothetical protein
LKLVMAQAAGAHFNRGTPYKCGTHQSSEELASRHLYGK